MIRVTKNLLQSRVQNLNMLLERPLCLFAPGATASQQNIGHLSLDCQHSHSDGVSYRLVECVSGSGAERDWSDSLRASEMYQFLDGMVKGIAIRNAHLTQYMLKQELTKNGVTEHPELYSDELTEAVRPFVKV